MKITERQLRGIIRKCLMEALEEGGTNLQSLYHFTEIWSLPGIFESGVLMPSNGQEKIRNGKKYISFTRHRSNLEGFAFESGDESPIYVRLELDGRALSNVRGVDIYPFEYYSPNRRKFLPGHDHVTCTNPHQVNHHGAAPHYENVGWKGYPADMSAAAMYQDPNFDDDGEWSYLHQAEESLETDHDVPIKNALKRVDIIAQEMTLETLHYYDFFTVDEYFFKEFEAVMETNSPFIDKCFVYESNKDFCLQTNNCMPLRKYFELLKHKMEQLRKIAGE